MSDKISPVILRLIEEIKREGADAPRGYNRMHNRHNRSGGGGRPPMYPRPAPAPAPEPEPNEDKDAARPEGPGA